MLVIRTCPERRYFNGLNSGRLTPSPTRECSIAPAPSTRGMQSPMLSSLVRLQPALLTAPGGAPASPEPGRSPAQDEDAGRQAAQDKASASRLSFAGKLYRILHLLPSRVDGRRAEEFLSNLRETPKNTSIECAKTWLQHCRVLCTLKKNWPMPFAVCRRAATGVRR